MSVRFFHYLDSGAPQLSNTAGSAWAIIKACAVGTSGVAYGSGGSAKAAIGGWTIPYEVGNKGTLKSPAGTSQYVWRFDDTGPGAGGVTDLRVHGYKTMSDIDTGTGRFPNTTVGCPWRKAQAANRPWWLVGDDRTLYFYDHWYPTGSANGALYILGEFDSFLPADVNNVLLTGQAAENQSGSITSCLTFTTSDSTSIRKVAYNQFTAGLDNDFCPASILTINEGSVGAPASEPYPGASGGLILRPVLVKEGNGISGTTAIRGRFRGMFHHGVNVAALASGSLITTVDGFPGRSFRVSELIGNLSQTRPIFDITGPW